MRRAFGIDVLARPRCGGRLRLIATVENPAVMGTILAPLGLLHPADSPGPAPRFGDTLRDALGPEAPPPGLSPLAGYFAFSVTSS
jgi:hypothetical protein